MNKRRQPPRQDAGARQLEAALRQEAEAQGLTLEEAAERAAAAATERAEAAGMSGLRYETPYDLIGSGPDVAASAAAATGLPVSLILAAAGAFEPDVTIRLRQMGSRTMAMETNVARAPIFGPSGSSLQLALEWPELAVYGRRFLIREMRGPLTPRDQLLLTDVMTSYVRAGCPTHRRVPFSLSAASELLGYAGEGGRQRELVKESLRRLRAISFESTVRYPGENGRAVEEAMEWSLIGSWRTTTAGGGMGSVTLSDELAHLIRSGSVTFLDGPTYRELIAADPIAARLWSFLEAETLPRTWRYAIFAAPPGQPAREGNLPALADLLRLRWARPRRVADRIREAAGVIERIDPRYRLAVVKSPEPGMYRLEATRSRRYSAGRESVPAGAEDGTQRGGDRYLEGRDRAQNGGVPSYLPSSSTVEEIPSSRAHAARGVRSSSGEPEDVAALLERWPKVTPAQRRILAEIADRHDVTGRAWAAERIRATPPGADPIQAVLEADRVWQAERLERVDAEELAAETRRAAERDAATPAFSELMRQHGASAFIDRRPPEPEGE